MELMMKNITKLLALCFSLALFGCAKQYQVPPLLDTKDNESVTYSCEAVFDFKGCWFARKVPKINPYKFRPDCVAKDDPCESYYTIATGFAKRDYNATQRRNARNYVVNALIAASLESTSSYQAGVQVIQSDSNLFFKLATAALTGAGAVSGASAAQALSAAAAGTNTAQSSVSEEIYQKQLAGNINGAVAEAKKAKLLEIYTSLAEKNADQYNVQRGIADAVEFHQLSSFYKALEISNEALSNKTAEQSQVNLKAVNDLNKKELNKNPELNAN
jgi:hypothetical protein